MRDLRSLAWLGICLLPGLLQSTLAQDANDKDHGVRWVYPARSDKYTFHYQDIIEVEYTSYFDQPILYTFCLVNGGAAERSQDYATPLNGTTRVKLDWTDAEPPCWFNLRPNSSAGYGSNSDSFGYNTDARSQPATLGADISSTATVASSTPTSSATSTTTDAATTASATSDADSDSSTSGGKQQLSVGAQIGIGVAAGLVGAGLGVYGAMMWMRRRKRQKAMAAAAAAAADDSAYAGDDYKGFAPSDGSSPVPPPPGYAEMDNTAPRPELDSVRAPGELSSANYHGR